MVNEKLNISYIVYTVCIIIYNKSKMSEIQECSICLNEIVVSSRLNCGHTFCDECIKKSILINKLCPLCRQLITHINDNDTEINSAVKDSSDDFIDLFGDDDNDNVNVNTEINSAVKDSSDDFIDLFGNDDDDNINNNINTETCKMPDIPHAFYLHHVKQILTSIDIYSGKFVTQYEKEYDEPISSMLQNRKDRLSEIRKSAQINVNRINRRLMNSEQIKIKKIDFQKLENQQNK